MNDTNSTTHSPVSTSIEQEIMKIPLNFPVIRELTKRAISQAYLDREMIQSYYGLGTARKSIWQRVTDYYQVKQALNKYVAYNDPLTVIFRIDHYILALEREVAELDKMEVTTQWQEAKEINSSLPSNL